MTINFTLKTTECKMKQVTFKNPIADIRVYDDISEEIDESDETITSIDSDDDAFEDHAQSVKTSKNLKNKFNAIMRRVAIWKNKSLQRNNERRQVPSHQFEHLFKHDKHWLRDMLVGELQDLQKTMTKPQQKRIMQLVAEIQDLLK